MAATHVCSTNTTNTLGSRQTCIAHGITSAALRCRRGKHGCSLILNMQMHGQMAAAACASILCLRLHHWWSFGTRLYL